MAVSSAKIKHIIAVILFFFCVYAQDDMEGLNLQDLFNIEITTASKRAERIIEAPGVVEVITAEEITAMGANNLVDVLDRASSIQIWTNRMFHNNKCAIRGDANDYQNFNTLILLNGQPLREGSEGGHDYPVFQLFPVNIIDHIEIVRGPGSVLYGTNAVTGVVNIITKDPEKEKASIELGLQGHSFEGISQEGVFSYKKGNFDVILGDRFFKEEGWINNAKGPGYPYFLPSQTQYKMAENNFGAFTKMRIKDFHLSSFYGGTHYKNSMWPMKEFIGSFRTHRLFVCLEKITPLWGEWEMHTSGNLNYINEKFYRAEEVNALNNLPPEQYSSHNASDYVFETYFTGNISRYVNLLLGGLIFSMNSDKTNFPTSIRQQYSILNYSGYIQADTKLFDRIKFIAGAQLNRPEEGEGYLDIVPRLGLVASTPFNLGTKILYGQAYAIPYPSAKLFQGEFTLHTDMFVDAKISTFDAQLFYTHPKVTGAATFFRSRYLTLLETDTDGNYIVQVGWDINGNPIYDTLSSQSSKDSLEDAMTQITNGVEAEVKASPLKGLFVMGSFFYQWKENYQLIFSPDIMWKIGLSYSLPKNFPIGGLTVGVFNTFFGEPNMKGLWPSMFKDNVPKSVSLLSLNFIYTLPRLDEKVEFSVYIQNLLDQEYLQADTFLQSKDGFRVDGGRSIHGGLKIKF